MKKVIVLVGTTGVGKTRLSLDLCEYYQGQVINADASQTHKLLNIGTAKILENEMRNIPHHLFDIIDCLEDFSIKDYVEKARDIIDNANYLPFIVGGSGLYVKSLIYTYNLEAKPRQNSSEFDSLTNLEVYEYLERLDKEVAKKVHYNNRKRVIRYIELVRQYEKMTFSKPVLYYDAFVICLTRKRELLYEAINSRCEKMLNSGWIEEALNLKKQGYDLQKIKEIGYKEIDDYLQGLLTYPELQEQIKKKTRHYAKRQVTWFKNQLNCYNVDMDEENLFSKLVERIDQFLNK